ncbi:FAD-dependent oxidoreductase, partial [Rhizobium ruizarguesonis]
AAEQRRSFDARFPGLESLPMEYSWAGALCLSRNHVPAFGEVEEGLFSACGSCGEIGCHHSRKRALDRAETILAAGRKK